MPREALAGKLILLTRAQVRDAFLRNYSIRNPGAKTGPGTTPYLDASVFADATMVHGQNAVIIANGTTRATANFDQLKAMAEDLGTEPKGPVGGSGAVIVSAASGGTTILAGDVLTDPATQLRFQCLATGTYLDGDEVPIQGLDTGPGTNLAAGTKLTWSTPRVGCAPTCAVATQADGSGLSDGANAEGATDLRQRLDDNAANPPASGNDAQYQDAVSNTATLAVQQAFTYPCFNGPGSQGVAFTIRPTQLGATRIPNGTQLTLALAALAGEMPADDGIYPITLLGSDVTVVLKVKWARNAESWADVSPWPTYIASPNLVKVATPATGTTSATYFRLDATGITEPQVGQSIGFLDLPNLTFRRKKILSYAADGSGGWDITVDTSGGVSDTSYVPQNGDIACPWSDSLDSLIEPVLTYFDSLGPGEMFASFFDEGLRQRRSPPSPQKWPNQVTNRLLGGALIPVPPSGTPQNQPAVPTLFTTPTIEDVLLVEPTVPYSTPVGTPGVSVNLLQLGALAAFPE